MAGVSLSATYWIGAGAVVECLPAVDRKASQIDSKRYGGDRTQEGVCELLLFKIPLMTGVGFFRDYHAVPVSS